VSVILDKKIVFEVKLTKISKDLKKLEKINKSLDAKDDYIVSKEMKGKRLLLINYRIQKHPFKRVLILYELYSQSFLVFLKS